MLQFGPPNPAWHWHAFPMVSPWTQLKLHVSPAYPALQSAQPAPAHAVSQRQMKSLSQAPCDPHEQRVEHPVSGHDQPSSQMHNAVPAAPASHLPWDPQSGQAAAHVDVP